MPPIQALIFAFFAAVLAQATGDANLGRIIGDMASDVWEIREAASLAAAEVGGRGLLQLEVAAATHRDHEVRRRCAACTDAILDQEVAKLGKMPWITVHSADAFACPQHFRRYLLMAMAESPVLGCQNPWPAWNRATELYCRDLLRVNLSLGLGTGSIEAMLVRMRDEEAKCKARAAGEMPPPD